MNSMKWVILKKLIVTHLVKKFRTFYELWKPIIFMKFCCWILSWAYWIHSTSLHSIPIRSLLILSSHLWQSHNLSLHFTFPAKILYAFFIALMCITCHIHLILLIIQDWSKVDMDFVFFTKRINMPEPPKSHSFSIYSPFTHYFHHPCKVLMPVT
jgi:hypothetical protein